jgi:Rrf2 family protein
MIARRNLLAVAAVVDVALHARGQPVAAKALAARHGLAPRHLEPLLQGLVRANILKGTRGPRGGYELARERRRISAGDIVRALDKILNEEKATAPGGARLFDEVIAPMVAEAANAFLAALDRITVEDLCRRADQKRIMGADANVAEFHI